LSDLLLLAAVYHTVSVEQLRHQFDLHEIFKVASYSSQLPSVVEQSHHQNNNQNHKWWLVAIFDTKIISATVGLIFTKFAG
jgi:hypothetical protein